MFCYYFFSFIVKTSGGLLGEKIFVKYGTRSSFGVL